MGMGIKVRVWGDYALFSRPELKVERYSYDVMIKEVLGMRGDLNDGLCNPN